MKNHRFIEYLDWAGITSPNDLN